MIDTNSFVGTEEYIAPEVIKGSGQVTSLALSGRELEPFHQK